MSTNHFLTHAILGWEAKLAVANLLAKEDLSPITGSAQAVLGRPYLHHMPTVIHEVCIFFRFCVSVIGLKIIISQNALI